MMSGGRAARRSSRRAAERSVAVRTTQDQPSRSGRIAASTAASLSMQSTVLPESTLGARRSPSGSERNGTAAPSGRLTEKTEPRADRYGMIQHARDPVDDREAEAKARGRVALVGPEPSELLEDDAELALGNAGPGIPHLDREAPVPPAAPDQHAAPPRIADGVRDEILQHPSQEGGIGNDHRPGWHQPETEATLLRHRLEGGGNALEHLADHDRARLRVERTGVELRYVEERLQQLVDGAERLVELMSQCARLRAAGTLGQGAREKARRVERLQQVVARRRQEPRLADVGRLGRGLRVAELLVEPRELVGALADPALQHLLCLADAALA